MIGIAQERKGKPMALNDIEDRVESTIRHICTALDIDQWAQNIVVESMRMRIALINGKQPEITRCKDCKYLQKWRSEESAKKFGQIYECARNVFDCPKPDDYCSWAERKTDGR